MKVTSEIQRIQQGALVNKKEEKTAVNSADFSQFLTQALNRQEKPQSISSPGIEPGLVALTPIQEEAIHVGYDILSTLANLEDALSKIVPGMEKRVTQLAETLISQGKELIGIRDRLDPQDELRDIINKIGVISVTEGHKILRDLKT